MSRVNRMGLVILAAALLAGIGWGVTPAPAQTLVNGAGATLRDAQGNVVGTATLTEDGAGVLLQVQVQGFAAAGAGEHGIHLHAVGTCEVPGFTTAGGHFNPAGKKHGLRSPEGAHGGDLPNLIVGADRSATYAATTTQITLAPGATSTILDTDGSAIVIHAGPDDYLTDPAGNSGARIACGVLQAQQVSAGMPRTGAPSAPAAAIWLVALALLAGAAGLVLRAARRQPQS